MANNQRILSWMRLPLVFAGAIALLLATFVIRKLSYAFHETARYLLQGVALPLDFLCGSVHSQMDASTFRAARWYFGLVA